MQGYMADLSLFITMVLVIAIWMDEWINECKFCLHGFMKSISHGKLVGRKKENIQVSKQISKHPWIIYMA